MAFAHERFEAYRLSTRFFQLSLMMSEQIPSGYADLKDQLRRAAISISLNIAEGTGKRSKADRRKFYFIARGSAMECAAICDVVSLIGVENSEWLSEGKTALDRIVGILTIVCREEKKK